MYTLGINAAYHDSSACLVHDGVVVAAAEEERFTRIKHAKRPVPFSAWELPYHAIDFCLASAGVDIGALDHVAYAYDPQQLLRDGRSAVVALPLQPSAHPIPEGWDSPWEPLFVSYVVNAPRLLVDGVPHHLQRRFGKAGAARYRWHFVDHHLAHEASAFLPSPFDSAAVLTMDGRGERATTSYAVGQGTGLERLAQIDLPHSLGLLYEEVTRYLGFLHSSDEYKVMALASFGKPRYRELFREILESGPDGRYRINDVPLAERLGPARRRGEALEERHFDVACSLQKALEETVLGMARWLHEQTGERRLCLAGGVALNCVMNGRLLREGPYDDIWVQPAAGDAGTALGAALWIDARERNDGERRYTMDHALLGPSYDEREIEAVLRRAGVRYRRLPGLDDVAELLARDRIVAWFQGAMEFGPRALGGRSILASPMSPSMQARLNDIKDREDFRPVAPVVLEEEAPDWFAGCRRSPFMLFVYDVLPERRARIPAVAHVDGTARVQTVNREQHPVYYDLLRAFQARTGVPVLVNTSFNTRGEPIVCTPRDALECFASSPLDALVMGPFLLEKRELLNDVARFRRRTDVPAPVSA
ncbi:carbamoyltransferase [Sulfurifustis variabilis]|uniref:Carbamoyltransferase n=1 Tax=Sulfurifustis variabilis TaxID=1675686 RepID=A0A1B4V4G2_9GAMM|nr:carbamoyltransferase [Sulfurifustis variabilis]BAU48285.1 carbamoyltransferase [Sulfurifustis variabilis]